MLHALAFWVSLLAVLTGGLLAGVSLDKALVQLPARRRMGDAAYAEFSRAADLGAGLLWYPLLGILAPALTVAAAALLATSIPAWTAAALAAFHVFTTSRAAPRMLRLRSENLDAEALAQSFRGFERWHRLRFAAQAATFVVVLWSLLQQVR